MSERGQVGHESAEDESAEEVRRERDHLRRLVELSDELLAVIGTDGRYCRVSPAFTRVLGWREADILAQPSSSFVHPDDRERTQRCIAHPTPARFENRHRHKDGSYRWLSWTAASVPESGLIYAAARDITEQRRTMWAAVQQARAEEALRESEERFRALVTASSDLVFRMSPDWRELRLVLGRELVADTHSPTRDWLQKYIPPEDQPRLKAALDEAIRTKSVFELEHRVYRVDGTMGWTFSRAIPLLDGAGQIVEWFGAASDVTQRRQAEEALRESEARFREMADGLPLIVWVHDASGQQEIVNATFCEFFGVTREEMKGGRWQMLMHPEDAEAYAVEFRACLQERRRFRAEVRVKRADGEWRWLESWGRPRLTSSGEFLGFVGTSADITERKRVEDQLRESDRRKDEFLAMLGHELRNPLAAIRNATALIRLAAPEDGRLQRAHGVLERQSTHMARLIDGLLEVSRVARGKIRLDLETLDARSVVLEVLEDRLPQLEADGLVLTKELPMDPLWICGDRVRLAQVLDNLVGNAIKFTRAPGMIRVVLREEEGCAVIRVRDTGVGIRAEMLDRVFDPFQQETQGMARAAGGLGLGLALAKGLVELHAGSIRVYSAGPGAGAELEVRLPQAPAPTVMPDEPQAPEAIPRRVLIVEDNLDAGQVLRDLLELLGHDVVVATSGIQALGALQERRADFVLCDLGLPGMSGYDVARAVRGDVSLRPTRLIALTGYGQPEDRERSLEAGFDAHLTKPVDLQTLHAVLREPPRG